ncbi:transcription factor HES-7-like [Alosa sapidissima]|uniref:transcription factor HES-7-like n=1 Tax=Alosa sapidissima TaxID=34773 RepID=UPI001C08E1AC|nr:transcription factor HES-7-like [Alosa sapidissima]
METAKVDRKSRRILKPVIEKQRRDRINGRLEELRALLLSTTQDTRLRNPKLEKAEILELTVEFIRKKADGQHTSQTLVESKDSQSRPSGTQAVGPTAELRNVASTCTRGPIGQCQSLGPAAEQRSRTDSYTRRPSGSTEPRDSCANLSTRAGDVFTLPGNHNTLYPTAFSLHPFAHHHHPHFPLPPPQISPSLHPFPSPSYSLPPPQISPSLHPFPSPSYSLSPPSSPCYSSLSPPHYSSSPPYLSVASCRFIFPASLSPASSDPSSSSASSPATSPGVTMATPPSSITHPSSAAPPAAPVALMTTPVQFRCPVDRGQPRRTLFHASSAACSSPVWRPWSS